VTVRGRCVPVQEYQISVGRCGQNIFVETDLHIDDYTVYRPDLCAYARTPQAPQRLNTPPELVVEVLSPSTAAHDRGVKLAEYRKIASIEQILLVASEDRHVEVWLRAEDGWKVQDLIGDAAIPLAIDGQPLPLADIYDGVAL
jgi:Uma2 family endonuclease